MQLAGKNLMKAFTAEFGGNHKILKEPMDFPIEECINYDFWDIMHTIDKYSRIYEMRKFWEKYKEDHKYRGIDTSINGSVYENETKEHAWDIFNNNLYDKIWGKNNECEV